MAACFVGRASPLARRAGNKKVQQHLSLYGIRQHKGGATIGTHEMEDRKASVAIHQQKLDAPDGGGRRRLKTGIEAARKG